MKKASFTLFQSQRWISNLGKSTLMVLFALCFLGLENVNAQIVHANGAGATDTSFVATDLDCSATPGVLYRDDNSGDGSLYADPMGQPRADTVTICPKTKWDIVTVTFSGPTQFDLAAGDTLGVYDGNLDSVRANDPGLFATGGLPYTAAPLIGSGSGVGANGTPNGAGWVSASCDPSVNPSGCLTFIFATNGDNRKGAGWEAWATCSPRGASIVATSPNPINATCTTIPTGADGGAPIATNVAIIAAVAGNGCALGATSQVEVILSGAQGECLRDTVALGATAATLDLAPGNYVVYHTLIGDKEKKDTSFITVNGPALTCNDRVESSLGAGCSITFNPDMLLEGNFCDTSVNVQYWIAVKDADDKLVGTGSSVGSYPTIDKDAIKDYCGGAALTATITRKFTYPGAQAMGCSPYSLEESCEVEVFLKDNSVPFFNRGSRTDTLVGCDTTNIARFLVTPTAFDNCGLKGAITHVITPVTTTRCADVHVYNVKWTATDNCNKTATLTDIVRIVRSNVFVNAANVETDCSNLSGDDIADVSTAYRNSLPGLVRGRLVNGVLAPIDTIALSKDKYICDYILTEPKLVKAPSDCGAKFFVTWSYVDWCNAASGGVTQLGTQFIHFTDTIAPVIDDATIISLAQAEANPISLGHFNCSLTSNPLPVVTATDNCSKETVSMVIVQRKNKGAWSKVADNIGAAITAKALVCDTFRVVYQAVDDCHTQLRADRDTSYFVVQDDTKPSAICVDQLNVSVPNNWGSRIHYTDVDAGSTDNCAVVRTQIRREGTTAWADNVDIGCTDVHADVRIELGVWDAKGNFNSCWMTVLAEDKIAPVCTDLPKDSLSCSELHTGELGEDTKGEWVKLEQGGTLETLYNTKFGNPPCEDNLTCVGLRIEQEYKLTNKNCGELTLERRWRARDWEQALDDKGNRSGYGYQTIEVQYTPDWTLTFPKDESVDCNGAFPAAWTAAEVIQNGSCDLFALEVTERTFNVPGDICLKIERTYEVINWCVYGAGDSATRIPNNANGDTITHVGNTDKGRFTYVQVLKLYANDAPSIELAPVDTCITAVSGDAEPFGVEDRTPGSAPYECDEEKTFSASGRNCAGVLLASGNFTHELYEDEVLVKTDTGGTFKYTVQPNKAYRAKFLLTDGCGNSAWAEDTYRFWDCKRPTPYVLSSLSIEIMQTGMIQVWAKDLDRGSYDNCTESDKLDFRIFHVTPTSGEGPSIDDKAGVDSLSKNITFVCPQDIGRQIVMIYVIDAKGNIDVVGTEIRVQDNNEACSDVAEGDGMVAGKILNPAGENVELVKVSVNGGSEDAMTTGATGTYTFNLATGGDYTITPEKNVDPLNGVSTYDLVLMSKHILGLQAFDSPYKYIAADVNKSGSITAFDMVELRKLILNITSEFPNNSSWRFVDSKYEFTTDNPAAENFGEFMSINNLEGEMMNVDFVATKIGDINGNATANNLLGAETRNTNGALTINATDRLVTAGETVTVDFTSTDIATTQGYQFTMNFAGLELAEVVEGVAKAANFNTNLASRGVLTTSWDGEATANDVLFSLTLTANTAGLLSELVSLNSDLTVAEAYNVAGDLLDVTLAFNSSNVSAAFELEQNTPNPFNGETVIGFNLPEAGTATVKVMDVQGKVLRSIEGEYTKGYNQVTINAKTLDATGVLYYQLESSDNIATKKMIIIE